MSEIKAGDHIRVPKGTMVRKGGFWIVPEPSKRDIVVEVTSIIDARSYNRHQEPWAQFLTYEETWNRDKNRALAEQRMGDGIFVTWSDGMRCAWLKDVVKVDPPAPKKAAEPEIGKRQQMVKGSRWRFPVDTDVVGFIDNPAFEAHWQHMEAKRPRLRFGAYKELRDGPWKGTFGYDDPVWFAWMDELWSVPPRVEGVIRRVKAGEEFVVTNKSTLESLYFEGSPRVSNGTMIRLKFDGDANEIVLPFKAIEAHVEAVTLVEQHVFVLRDTATGEFYSGTGWNANHTGFVAQMNRAFTKSKRWDRLSDVKSALLGLTGYYDGLPGAMSLPDWIGGPKVLDLPPSWELVEYDKLTKKELRTVEFREWFDRAWKLRPLTMTFGSSVRSLYSEIEKRGEVSNWLAMVVFRSGRELTPTEIAGVKAAVKTADMKVLSGKDASSYAVAVSTVTDAVSLRLSYDGTLSVNVIDLADMIEVVERQERNA